MRGQVSALCAEENSCAPCAGAGENIMIDARSGDCVHVDFSCLFDRGLSLEKPELTPFRLTQNILDAFGPAGPEGAFRRCCEITLQVGGRPAHTLSTTKSSSASLHARECAQWSTHPPTHSLTPPLPQV